MESVPEPCSHSAGATPGPWEACPPGGGIVLPPVICHSTLLLKADILLCHAFRNVCSAHKHLKICVSYALSAQERLSPLQAGAHALHGDGYGAEIEAQAQRGCRSLIENLTGALSNFSAVCRGSDPQDSRGLATWLGD